MTIVCTLIGGLFFGVTGDANALLGGFCVGVVLDVLASLGVKL